MENEELAELLLMKVYENAESKGYGSLCSLFEIAKELKENDLDKVHEISKVLESRNLINAVYTESGEPLVNITGEGAILIEAGGKTGILNKYYNQININMGTNINNVNNSNISVGSDNVNQKITNKINEIDEIFETMIKILKEDKTLSEDDRNDAILDIETIKGQLSKKNIDKSFIEKCLENLNKFAPLLPYLPILSDAVSKIFNIK